MGRHRRSFPRSRVPLHRRLLTDRATLRRWAVVALAALVVTAAIGRALGHAEAARARWGDTAPVLVASGDVPAGADLAGRVRTEPWPIALVPAGALTELPAEARTAGALAAGTPLTAAALAPAEGGDDRRLAVPVGPATPPVEPGQLVEVWATFDPSLATTGPTTRRVALRARVVSSTPEAVVVEVPSAAVADVAEALATATTTLVLIT